MGTRAAAFTAKIHNLQHYNSRIQHCVVPLPSGDDVANTLKYFSQTLLSVLKDVPSISLDMLRSPERDNARISLFPSLDYKGLYNAIVELADAVPLLQHGAHALGHTILHTLSCLVPFLEHEYMDTLPYLVASSMTLFPCSLHKDIVDMLCNHLLPFTFIDNCKVENQSYASMSTAAVLMMVFQYTDCSAYHCQVLECMMSLKRDIVKDLLCVIAHGTAKARCHAVELLFQYLPTLNPALLDRKGIGNKLNGWKPLPCQREDCQRSAGNEAIKMCFNHSVAIGSGEQPPPLYVCESCADEITKELGPQCMTDVLLPMDKVSVTCENMDCKSSDKSAIATCFAVECANQNGHKPIRYCSQCLVFFHNKERGMDHIVHTTIPSPWDMDLETQSYMVEAIISLLREAEPMNEKHASETSDRPYQSNVQEEDSKELNTVEERQLLSRYGIWMLVGLCTPDHSTPVESLGRLLSMLFQWFHYTACLPDDQAGNALERLKAEYIHGWLMEVVKTHFEVFVSCLIPHPLDYAQVGGHWETWPSSISQIKEGFKRLLCLVPYDIITLEVWEFIMPYWMEAFRHEIVESEISELKILISKVLDPDLSPLGFNTKQMYKFLSVRFENTAVEIQEQALYWLQILTLLEVPIPLDLLFDMFAIGIEAITLGKQGNGDIPICCLIPHPSQPQNFPQSSAGPSGSSWPLDHPAENADNVDPDQSIENGSEINVTCYILILDILIKQLELQEIPSHKGLGQKDAQSVMLLLRDILKAPWVGVHTCSEHAEGTQCMYCEITAIWFQLCLVLIEYFSPVMEVTMADIPVTGLTFQMSYGQNLHVQVPYDKNKEDKTCDSEVSVIVPGKEEYSSQQTHSKPEEVTRTSSPNQKEEAYEFGLESVAFSGAADKVLNTSAEVTVTDDGIGGGKSAKSSPAHLQETEYSSHSHANEESSSWYTSEGKFKFNIDDLPPQLQLFYVLLKDLADFKDADVLYHILSCLKVMCLHSEVLNKAAQKCRGFLIWCQENLFILNLWKLMQSEFSHIAQLATSLLLHSITLPSGSDMFWKLLEQDFHTDEWRSRYAAVEKVTMIAHFVEPGTVKNSPLLQSSLANAFCYLVHCLDDIQPTVSQRALLNLETIKTSSIKLLLWCLEVQFDANIMDRPMIIQSVCQLYNLLSSRRFLSWDFFVNRFDTLFLEAQIVLERNGEVSYLRDLRNTNTNSEMFQKKVKRAQEAMSLVSSARSVVASFGPKWPYKRAMSAPGGMISQQEKLDRDKIYERQSSAPVLKRKSSRLIGSTVGPLGPLQHFPNSFFTDAHVKEMLQEETHFLNVLHRSMDLEDHDKDTLHLLVFLLMQFLSRPDPSHRVEEKVTRSQQIVLRHLNFFLGYSQSQSEGRFLIPPYKIRGSAVFCAFVMSMPKVLDYNFPMGNVILNTCLALLVCCPSSQKYPNEHWPPSYSLWLLDPHCRHSWLHSVLVIMYKYQYDSYPHSKYIQWLVIIVLNTLKSQRHKCKPMLEHLVSPLPSRSRDLSTPSADAENLLEKEKDASFEMTSIQDDIIKPFIGSGIKLKSFGPKYTLNDKGEELVLEHIQKSVKDKNERQQWKTWKASERSCSSEGEDVEPELEAIPESPKSESPHYDQFSNELEEIPQSLEEDCTHSPEESISGLKEIAINIIAVNSSDIDKDVDYSQIEHVPCRIIACDFDSSQVVEKAAVETMEKHIPKVLVRQDSTVLSGYEASLSVDKMDESSLCDLEENFRSQISLEVSVTNSVEKVSPILPEIIYMKAETTIHSDITSCDCITKDDKLSDNQLKINIFEQRDTNSVHCSSDAPHHPTFDISVENEKGSTSQKQVAAVKYYSNASISDFKQQAKHQSESSFEKYSETTENHKNNIHLTLSLKDSDASGVHLKHPRSKLFKSRPKKIKQGQYLTKGDTDMKRENVLKLMTRPPLERLLPVGLTEKEKARRFDTLDSQAYSLKSRMTHQLSLPQAPSNMYPPANRDMFEDKGVQTGVKDLPFDIPAPERLLPIGPPPSRKEWFTTPVFKSTLGECLDDKIYLVGDQLTVYSSEESKYVYPETTAIEMEKHKSSQLPAEKNFSAETKLPNGSKCSDTESDKLESVVIDVNQKILSENVVKYPSCLQKSKTVDFEERKPNNLEESRLSSDFLAGTFIPSALDRISMLGVYDVCKSAMEITVEPQPVRPNRKKDDEKHEYPQHRNSGGSLEFQANEKTGVAASQHDDDLIQKFSEEAPEKEEEVKCKLPFRQRKQKKPALSAIEQKSLDHQNAGVRRIRKVESGSLSSSGLASKRSSTSQSLSARCGGDDVVVERCTECGVVLEEYSDEELGLCIVILATFVHRESAMAAPLLPKMLRIVARIASSTSYPWQNESNVHLPGGSVSIARQFLRCTLHQLARNGVFIQIFQSHFLDADFFKTMAAALADFTELNQVTPLLLLFENLNDRKHLHQDSVFHILDNVATYLACLPLESSLSPWSLFLQQLELFLRKFLFTLSAGPCQLNGVLHIILSAIKMPVICSNKSILDPASKILSHAIQHSALDYHQLLDLCHFCYRNMSKERDKQYLTRTAIFELVQALKFKSCIPDANLLILVQFVLEDSGGSLGPNVIVEGLPVNIESRNMYNTCSAECMRQYLNDALEFVADVHTLNKVKNMLYGTSTHLNEETLGGQLKAGIAQYLAIEISKGNGRDNRAIGRYLPWLYHPPTTLQQGPKEFIDCVSHVRLLSWLLLGALIHSALMQNTETMVCQPIPLEANGHIVEHIQVILAGFSEQSKVSVLHMSSLFHAFILCQLWTMYCEHMVSLNPPGSEQNQICCLTLTDFWAKITPGILQLVCHSKVLAEMVSLHFLSLMEALLECNSTILARLLPMWTPVLYSFQGQLPGNFHVRLHACLSWQPPLHTREEFSAISSTFLRWLLRLQFKMGQIELQSSNATQFYSL